MNSDWLDYSNESHDSMLQVFCSGYDYDNPDTFFIQYLDEKVYKCELVLSDRFKGLVFIKGEYVHDGTVKHFAVGDDNIVYWQPPYSEPDLMVG